ncbi:hypothetical protein [Burkholderia gladioli]|uniref:hypothetical protein n=1 Tax=Burkholderia gladioli TaxID=28095 RepID=UPI00163F91E7|nr:hypothetical protein [Burkholderia gladioli]
MGNRPNVVPEVRLPSQSMLRQMNISFDSVELQGMNSTQRANAIRHLAGLLMQAAGIATVKECDDDER